MTTASQGVSPFLLLGPAMPCGGVIGQQRVVSASLYSPLLWITQYIMTPVCSWLVPEPHVPSMDFLPHTDHVGFILWRAMAAVMFFTVSGCLVLH